MLIFIIIKIVPSAMEGSIYFFLIALFFMVFNQSFIQDIYNNDISLYNLIWVYNINTKSLVEGSPF
jgi:hypothetical protein